MCRGSETSLNGTLYTSNTDSRFSNNNRSDTLQYSCLETKINAQEAEQECEEFLTTV